MTFLVLEIIHSNQGSSCSLHQRLLCRWVTWEMEISNFPQTLLLFSHHYSVIPSTGWYRPRCLRQVEGCSSQEVCTLWWTKSLGSNGNKPWLQLSQGLVYTPHLVAMFFSKWQCPLQWKLSDSLQENVKTFSSVHESYFALWLSP